MIEIISYLLSSLLSFPCGFYFSPIFPKSCMTSSLLEQLSLNQPCLISYESLDDCIVNIRCTIHSTSLHLSSEYLCLWNCVMFFISFVLD